jgi:hypothetical protein
MGDFGVGCAVQRALDEKRRQSVDHRPRGVLGSWPALGRYGTNLDELVEPGREYAVWAELVLIAVIGYIDDYYEGDKP